MIFYRALRRELIATAAAVFFTLITITVTMMLIRILGQAAKGAVDPGDVFALIGFSALGYMPIILILTGFVAVLLVVTRSYQDSEMVVWFSAGQSLYRWIKPVFQFGTPVVIAVALFGFVITPWAHKMNDEYRERFEKREDISRITPGKFQESAKGDRVFFVEKMDDDMQKVRHVFINSVKNNMFTTVISQAGTMGESEDDSEEKFVVMEDGFRIQEAFDYSEVRIMEFKRYLSYSKAQTAEVTFNLIKSPARAFTTIELIEMLPENLKFYWKFHGELLWRIGLPFMSATLMFLAIPLAFVAPRSGRSFSLIIAVLIYVIYSNMTSMIQASVSTGRMYFWAAWWPLHIVVALLAAWLFVMRTSVNPSFSPSRVFSPFYTIAAWAVSLYEKRFKGGKNDGGNTP